MIAKMSIEDQQESTSSHSLNRSSISPDQFTKTNRTDSPTNRGKAEPNDLTRANLQAFNDQQIMDTENDEGKVVTRGRNNRKRSNSTQSYVCVIAWLVKPDENDVRGESLMEHVQDIRRKYDNAYRRWEPHVTLIPPFVVPFSLSEDSQEEMEEKEQDRSDEYHSIKEITDPFKTLAMLSKRIEAVCASHSTQTVHFDRLSKFNLKRYDTFHLLPNQENGSGLKALLNLQYSLARSIPEAYEFSRGSISQTKRRQSQQQQQQQQQKETSTFSQPSGLPASSSIPSSINEGGKLIWNSSIADTGFKPHLTLGQANSTVKANEINVLVEPLLLHSSESINRIAGQYTGPLSVQMNKIQLFFKPINRSGPYDIYQEFTLR